MPIIALRWHNGFFTKHEMLAMSMSTFLDFAEKMTAIKDLKGDFEFTPPVPIQLENTKDTKKSVTIPGWVLKEVEEDVYMLALDLTNHMIKKRDALTRFKEVLRESGVDEAVVERILQKSGASPGEGTLQ
jgi:hypothetical protein